MRAQSRNSWTCRGAKALAVGVALLALHACSPKGPGVAINSGEVVTVVRANRGHELVVAKDGKTATVRLVGIYTFPIWPHEKTDISVYARAATEYLDSHVKDRNVQLILERPEPDPRARYLGFIVLDGVDINQKLIEEGHAAVYTEFPFSREAAYMAAEKAPRLEPRGLWAGHHAARRITALRDTWAAVRARKHSEKVVDPLLVESK